MKTWWKNPITIRYIPAADKKIVPNIVSLKVKTSRKVKKKGNTDYINTPKKVLEINK